MEVDKSESLGRWAYLARMPDTSADGYIYVPNYKAGHGPETVKEQRDKAKEG